MSESNKILEPAGESKLWRSLDELHASASSGEAPKLSLFNNDFLSRREFMEWTGGMVALLGAVSCTRAPQEKLIPYAKAPEEIIPGKPLFYATAMPFAGSAIGLLVESHMGRPTKIEGNPEHPASLGATDAFAQASILSLYDPDRSRMLMGKGTTTFWADFISKLTQQLAADKGVGLRILTETINSPTLAEQIGQLLKKYPSAKWYQFDPVSRSNEREGTRLAFGEPLSVRYAFDRASVVMSLDGDFLGSGGPSSVRYMRDYAKARNVGPDKKTSIRTYSVEASVGLAGANADHRLAVRPSEVESIAAALAAEFGIQVEGAASLSSDQKRWVHAAAEDLKANSGSSIIESGWWQSPVVHGLVHAINSRLGNAGKTVFYSAPVETNTADDLKSAEALVGEMKAGAVSTLVILGGNPAYNFPADLDFAGALGKVKFKVRLGLYEDETSALCDWHIPEAHYLEQWSDIRSFDGTLSVVQPLIAPLHGGKSAHEVIAALSGDGEKSGYDLVRESWKKRTTTDFEKTWRKCVHDGLLAGSASAEKKVAVRPESGWARVSAPKKLAGKQIEIAFRPDPTIWDGRFSNNGWLQELPKPITKTVWDNALVISPETARTLSPDNSVLESGQVVRVLAGKRSIEASVYVLPGHPNATATVHLGYGRTRAGRLGNKMGFNAYALRASDAYWNVAGVTIEKLNRKYTVATTQTHHSMEGRKLVRHAKLEQFVKDPGFAQEGHHGPKLPEGVDVGTAGGPYAPLAESDYRWAMAINLTTCTGCNSCVVACQAENNIAVVGKIEVERGREMHWLRIDRYYEGPEADPQVHFQPVPCMHCEAAPCEVVCPVNATEHDNEGLNNMVYNRCVGTKYCSNNCPYKVRRFNFYEYSDLKTPTLKMQRNPDVTVRSRGVMEKCSYCVQRINEARIDSKNQKRKIRDGEVKTACQSACPANAIVFGDINDPNSHISTLKKDPLNYALLGELNTKPRTTYLAKVKNPNAKMGAES